VEDTELAKVGEIYGCSRIMLKTLVSGKIVEIISTHGGRGKDELSGPAQRF
jgi:hypothetical protein